MTRSLPLVLLVAAVSLASAQDSVILNKQDCTEYLSAPAPTPAANTTSPYAIQPTIVLWQAIVMLLAFGVFALLVSLIHILVRRYIYYDSHLLDTFFDGGGDVNFALIACSVVAKWTWTSSITWSSAATKEFGLVGHFWYAAGVAIHLFLFSIVAVEIRIKAPGAKTFLQVIRARFGAVPHIVLMLFAFFVNLIVSAMVMSEGINIMRALTDGLSREVASIVLACVVGFATVVGGVGGFLYTALFSCVIMLSILMVYMADTFYDPSNREGNKFGSVEGLFTILQCGRGHEDNERYSLLTFLSQSGMTQGILLIISSFTSVFVDQSFWQSAVSGKPNHSVWGFLAGGVLWFALPFCGAFAFGMAYWALAVENGEHLISDADAIKGLLPVYVSQQLLGSTGDYLMFVFTVVAMVTTLASEVLAVASIIVYDIYQTYVAPFRPTPINMDGSVTVRRQKQEQSAEYMEYDRRCAILKRVVVICLCILLVPISLAVLALGLDLPWLFQFLAVAAGSAVVPVALAVTWHRATGAGVAVGAAVGAAVGLIAWLAYAATFDGQLEKFLENTRRTEVFLVGAATSLGAGGLLCVLVSLSCGGCDQNLVEEEEWEKTRKIDNPIVPWSVKYAPDVGSQQMAKGKPHFYTIRRAFKWSEISAYILGVLLAVCVVLIWPACMLMEEVFSLTTFQGWSIAVIAWTSLALLFVILVPIIMEIVQVCMQSYYNRQWADTTKGMSRLEEDPSVNGSMHLPPGAAQGGGGAPKDTQPGPSGTRPPPPAAASDAYSKYTDAESEMQSGMDAESNAADKERWMTFIHLE